MTQQVIDTIGLVAFFAFAYLAAAYPSKNK
jgi:hypothetical protein